MSPDVERVIQRRLATDSAWAASPLGVLARQLVDLDVPIPVAAEFIGVAGVVLRRWLYGYNGRAMSPGGRTSRRAEVQARIELLTRVIDAARWRERLRPPWQANLQRVVDDIQTNKR